MPNTVAVHLGTECRSVNVTIAQTVPFSFGAPLGNPEPYGAAGRQLRALEMTIYEQWAPIRLSAVPPIALRTLSVSGTTPNIVPRGQLGAPMGSFAYLGPSFHSGPRAAAPSPPIVYVVMTSRVEYRASEPPTVEPGVARGRRKMHVNLRPIGRAQAPSVPASDD